MGQHIYVIVAYEKEAGADGRAARMVDVDDSCYFGEDGAIARMNELNIKNPDYIHVVQRLECKTHRTLREKKAMMDMLLYKFKGDVFDYLAANPNRFVTYKEIHESIPQCWSDSTYRSRLYHVICELQKDHKPIMYAKRKGYYYDPSLLN